jgi:hypothetical protein
MKRCLLLIFWLIVAGLPLLAQEKVYPIRDIKDLSVVLTNDRSGFVVEKAFQHKLTLQFPDDDALSFFPDTKARLVMLWMRLQSVSQRPFSVDPSKFVATDEEGRTYTALPADEAVNRIMDSVSVASMSSKALRRLSLGKAGKPLTVDQIRADLIRYSIQPGEMAPGSVMEGMIYFEQPAQKKFTLKVLLGDLWAKPLTFSTEKQK